MNTHVPQISKNNHKMKGLIVTNNVLCPSYIARLLSRIQLRYSNWKCM